MDTALITTSGSELAIMPVMDVQMALARREMINTFVKQLMRRDVDYGTIPGAGDRPALFKAGAEKLTTLFGLTKRFAILEKVEDWDGHNYNGEPFIYYVYRCGLYRGDMLIAEADGSCNSHEGKYRYRQAQRVCPNCGQETIKKSKPPKTGWYCWAKLGGCGAQFRAGDKSIEGQEVGRVANPDVADQANTILKMAQKRALVAATLLAVNGSEFFSTKEIPGRDEDDQAPPVEDLDPSDLYAPTSPSPAPAPPASEPPANGHTINVSSGQELLELVNRRVEVPYDNVFHLQNALKLEITNFSWPKTKAGWQEAYDAAVKHANAKLTPELGNELDEINHLYPGAE